MSEYDPPEYDQNPVEGEEDDGPKRRSSRIQRLEEKVHGIKFINISESIYSLANHGLFVSIKLYFVSVLPASEVL